ncbi:Cucumisin [Quillaja saponaria]|uniref:Cucumisin n=1 Tax=Quillaja saponaria TaxID=32244 RepID=A0AAD7LMQ1_QUISA|nr:Cucumisin [Quillaja saponaria]
MQTYIVYMGDQSKGTESSALLHMNMVQKVIGSNFASDALLHRYKKSFNGFVVKLREDEVHKMAGMDGVVSVFPNSKNQLHTTRSWDFMGFSQQVKTTQIESDIIIGVLDTGIWPESDSFNDEGFGPAPSKWNGACQNITCNNKLIGAKYFRSVGLFGKNDIASPRDSDGHGTHTASTTTGSLVNSANLFGLGKGLARGGVPSARIAAYKICWSDDCQDADILAAFDEAIADGVDIISLSVGGNAIEDYFNNSIAIGSFHAMRNGILTSSSAGNNGPGWGTTANLSPWSLSVAASTTDRKLRTKVQLGNHKIYKGVSINTFNLKGEMYPLIYAGNAPNITGGFNRSISSLCLPNSLDEQLVKGKMVLCDFNISPKDIAFLSGAAGAILRSLATKDIADSFALPTIHLTAKAGLNVFSYINSTRNPTSTILKTNVGNDTLAPYVASFSSRGPNLVTPNILKPDISAPGVNILAAWSPISPISRFEGDNRVAQFNIISGTSMACPHVTGAAAYVKSFHPKWSPAAIKSALMTTVTPMSVELNPDAEFAYGAGHIDPIKAVTPGLVYDASEIDYIKFLCGQGYDTQKLRIVTGDESSCSEVKNGIVWDLNYPSFALLTKQSMSFNQNFHRTVTNVGSKISAYRARVTAPSGLKIYVTPRVLSFTSFGQRKSFKIKIQGKIDQPIVSASLIWDDGTFQVRSPILVYYIE